MKHSGDYHDYVFRDGKLVGDFEGMYRYSDDIPWGQDKVGHALDTRLSVELLGDFEPFDEIHDLGCGLGYYLSLLCARVGAPACRGVGYDISDTACAKASKLHPGLTFHTMDLTAVSANRANFAPPAPGTNRLFVIRGTLWYVVPKLANVVQVIRRKMSAGDKLLVVQNFPPLHSDFVGKDVMPNHHALLECFSASFALMRHLWYEDSLSQKCDSWFIGLFSLGDIE